MIYPNAIPTQIVFLAAAELPLDDYRKPFGPDGYGDAFTILALGAAVFIIALAAYSVYHSKREPDSKNPPQKQKR